MRDIPDEEGKSNIENKLMKLNRSCLKMDKNEKLKEFVKNNHYFVEKYYDCYFKKSKENNWKEQLRFLFLDAINSSGEGNVNNKADSIEKFEKNIKNMKNNTFDELLSVFKTKNYKELFEKLKGKEFKGIGDKISALFLRNVLYFEKHNIIKIDKNKIKEIKK